MEPPKLRLTWKTILFPLLGIAGFLIYIYLLPLTTGQQQVDLWNILSNAKEINLPLYGVAILFGLLEVLFFTLSWKILTNHLEIKMTTVRAYLYVWYGIYVDTIVPAQSISGEVTRTYLCTRDKCGPSGKVVASLFTHRLLGMALNVVALIAGIVLLTFGGKVYPLVFNALIFVTAIIVGIIVLMFVLSFKQKWTLKIIDFATNTVHKITFGKVNLTKFTGQAVEVTQHFHEAMQEFRHAPKP